MRVIVLGYIVPRYALPGLSDSFWADVPAHLANDSLPVVIAVVVVALNLKLLFDFLVS